MIVDRGLKHESIYDGVFCIGSEGIAVSIISSVSARYIVLRVASNVMPPEQRDVIPAVGVAGDNGVLR